ncbi:MAG: CHAT domain-containing protein [Ignavibacteriae bacterium]|nr:CHAT domain-containing protein [Ignavibacteriota bacterium]
MSVIASSIRPFIILSLLCYSGCSNEPSPEEKQADRTLRQAKEAIAEGKHTQSRALLLSALTLDEKLGRAARLAEESELLAHNYSAGATIDSALMFYRRALEQYKGLGNRRKATGITLQIAATHRLMGEEHAAFDILLEAERLANVFGDDEGVREIGWALLPLCRAVDSREEEVRILNNLLMHSTASGGTGSQARIHFEFGMSGLHRGEYTGAVESFLRALTLADQSRDSLLAISALQQAAIAFDKMGKTADAFQMYTDALTRSDTTPGADALREEMLIRVGNIYLRSRQYENARRFFSAAQNSALQRKNLLAEGYLSLQLGHCDFEAPSRREDATRRYKSALDMFMTSSFPRGMAYALLTLGAAAQRSQKPNEALQYFKSAADQRDRSLMRPSEHDVYEDCEHTFQTLHQSHPYDALVEQLLSVGNYTEAFLHIERKNERDVFDVLSVIDISVRNEELRGALQNFKHRKGIYIAAEHQLAAALKERATEERLIKELRAVLDGEMKAMEDIASSIRELKPGFEALASFGNVRLGEIQLLVPPGVAFIQYALTRRSMYMYVITSSEIAVQLSAIEKERVRSLVGEFVALLRTRNNESRDDQIRLLDRRLKELNSLLYGIFIRPMERNTAGLSKLIVVLPAELSALPLHALRSESWRAGGYLIEQHMVSYLPTARSLSLKSVRTASPPDIIAIGNPGGTEWDVEYELRDIRAFYKDARLYFDQKASLTTLQTERGDVLHCAAAFHFNERAPANSYLVLSDEKSIDTRTELRWGELFSIPPFSTVIISNLAGESAMHPAQPMIFLTNGSADVILTAYPPARKTKKFFGEVFYTTLLSGGSTQNAYREALLRMIKEPEYSSPHHWASLFHWGK